MIPSTFSFSAIWLWKGRQPASRITRVFAGIFSIISHPDCFPHNPPLSHPRRTIPAKPFGVFCGLVTSSQVSLPLIGCRCVPPASSTGPLPGTARRVRLRTHAPMGMGTRSLQHRSMTGMPPASAIKLHSSLLSPGMIHKNRGLDITSFVAACCTELFHQIFIHWW